MRVLEEVGGFFLDQTIGVFVLGIHGGVVELCLFQGSPVALLAA